MKLPSALAILLALDALACGRRIVIDPEEVPARNSPGWVVKHPQEPRAVAPIATKPAAAAPSDAGTSD